MKIWKIESENVFFEQVLEMKEEEIVEAIKPEQKNKYYGNIVKIPKIKGFREVYCINRNNPLYKLQKKLCINFLDNIMLSDATYGFKKQSNYSEFLLPHIDFYKNNWYLRLDIRNFFDSIDYNDLKEVLEYYFKENEEFDSQQKEKVLGYCLEILTNNEKVVQGAVSSPVISNIIFRSLDIRIARYCRKYDINYSRYADDLLFSSNNYKIHSNWFLSGITKILSDKNFYINYKKTIKKKEEISMGGYVVSDSLRLSRKKLSNLSRILFYVENNKYSSEYFSELDKILEKQMKIKTLSFKGKYSLINYLAGNRAYIINVLRYTDDEGFRKKGLRLLNRIEQCILKIYNFK